jgi:hypothetical protein
MKREAFSCQMVEQHRPQKEKNGEERNFANIKIKCNFSTPVTPLQ